MRGPSGSIRKRSSHATGRFGKLAKISSKRASMVANAALHAPRDERQVGLLPAFVLPALEHGGEQKQLGQDVAEARRDHLPPLEPAAQRQQRDIDRERERRGIAAERLVELACARRPSGAGAKMPPVQARPQARNALREAVADMRPEHLVEFVEAARAVLVFERHHLLEQVGMAADRSLAELDQRAGDDVRAFDRDADRHRAIEPPR